MEWLRHAPAAGRPPQPPKRTSRAPAAGAAPAPPAQPDRPHPAPARAGAGPAGRFWRDIDAAALFADFGFGARLSLRSELLRACASAAARHARDHRPGRAVPAAVRCPTTPAWLEALDDATLRAPPALLGRVAARRLARHAAGRHHILVSAVHAAGYSPALRQRMDPALLRTNPFASSPCSAAALRARCWTAATPTRCRKPPTCVRCSTPAAAPPTA
jgi:hypothetical protein